MSGDIIQCTVMPQGSQFRIHLSEDNLERIANVLEALPEVTLQRLRSRVFVEVKGYRNVAPYVRSMPNKAHVGNMIGKEFFELAGALFAIGFQAYRDKDRDDLNGSQKTGRASLALLGGAIPPLGLVMLGASIVAPEESDKFTAALFTDKNPVVAGLSSLILRVGGKRFQEWSVKPSWIDFF